MPNNHDIRFSEENKLEMYFDGAWVPFTEFEIEGYAGFYDAKVDARAGE